MKDLSFVFHVSTPNNEDVEPLLYKNWLAAADGMGGSGCMRHRVEEKYRASLQAVLGCVLPEYEKSASHPDLAPLLREIRSSLSPDCEANGILLSVVPAAVTVYAKPKMLISVLHNLVFNAIEHAECSRIEITAERTPKACRIRVIDDGKGIEAGEDVFRPYYSEHPARENMV